MYCIYKTDSLPLQTDSLYVNMHYIQYIRLPSKLLSLSKQEGTQDSYQGQQQNCLLKHFTVNWSLCWMWPNTHCSCINTGHRLLVCSLIIFIAWVYRMWLSRKWFSEEVVLSFILWHLKGDLGQQHCFQCRYSKQWIQLRQWNIHCNYMYSGTC